MNNNKDIYLYNRNISKNNNYNIMFVFPGPKSFALSSLGYLWLYKEIDLMDGVNIEMVYSDSNNSTTDINKVDLIGFSMSFDMDFIKVFDFFNKNKYPYKSLERGANIPLIYAGGPVVTSNPEPYKNIFDFFIIGDGEDVNVKVIDICKQNKGKTKSEILKELSNIEGVYIPSIHKNTKINKSTKKLTECVYTPIISNDAFFPNTFILEVERGCANRCAFCLASYMNLPIRFPQYEKIIETIDLGLKHTNKIALLGAQITAHPDFEKICKYVRKRIDSGERIEMGISSLRVDSFKKEIVETLVKAGQKNLTLAIEAGSERLRKVINKNLSKEQIFQALDVAIECKLKGIKIYAMVGIPTETDNDINEIINLCREIKNQYKNFNITLAFSTFVPKPNTPFQWFGREETKSLEKKLEYIRKELHKLGIETNIPSPKWDYYQAVLSRGDEHLTDYLIKVYEYGGKIGAFKKARKELNINTDYYALEDYTYNEELPWDFIQTKPGREFLIQESKRLLT